MARPCRIRPFVFTGRIHFDNAQRFNQPLRGNGQNASRGTLVELIVTSPVNGFFLILFHPHPVDFIITPQIKFGAGQSRFSSETKSVGPFKSVIRFNRGDPGLRDGQSCPSGLDLLHPTAVGIHDSNQFFERGIRRQNDGRIVIDQLPVLRTTGAAHTKEPGNHNQIKQRTVFQFKASLLR